MSMPVVRTRAAETEGVMQGAAVFIGLFFGICYLGYLFNRKPGETFTQYLADSGDMFEPLEQELHALNRGEIIRRR